MGGFKIKKLGKKIEKPFKRAAPIVVGSIAGGPVGALAGYHTDKLPRAKKKMAGDTTTEQYQAAVNRVVS